MSEHWTETAIKIANEELYRAHLQNEMEKVTPRIKDEGSIPIIKEGTVKIEETVNISISATLEAEITYHAHSAKEEPLTSPLHGRGKLYDEVESVLVKLPDANGNIVTVDIKKLLSMDEIVEAIESSAVK